MQTHTAEGWIIPGGGKGRKSERSQKLLGEKRKVPSGFGEGGARLWASWRGVWRSAPLQDDPRTVGSFIHRVSDSSHFFKGVCTCEVCFTMVRRSHLLSPLISFSQSLLSHVLSGAASVFWQLTIQHHSLWRRPAHQPPACHPKTSSLLTLLHVASLGPELSGFIGRAQGHPDSSQQGRG